MNNQRKIAFLVLDCGYYDFFFSLGDNNKKRAEDEIMAHSDLDEAMKRCGFSAADLELKTLDDFKNDPSCPSDEVAKLRFMAFLL